MRLSTANLSALAAAGVLIAASAAQADHGQLSADQLNELIPGATLYGTSTRGAAYVLKYASDGSMTVQVGANFSDSGRWTIEDDTICAQWQKIRDGEKACWEVFHDSGDAYDYEGIDGADDTEVRIVK